MSNKSQNTLVWRKWECFIIIVLGLYYFLLGDTFSREYLRQYKFKTLLEMQFHEYQTPYRRTVDKIVPSTGEETFSETSNIR